MWRLPRRQCRGDESQIQLHTLQVPSSFPSLSPSTVIFLVTVVNWNYLFSNPNCLLIIVTTVYFRRNNETGSNAYKDVYAFDNRGPLINLDKVEQFYDNKYWFECDCRQQGRWQSRGLNSWDFVLLAPLVGCLSPHLISRHCSGWFYQMLPLVTLVFKLLVDFYSLFLQIASGTNSLQILYHCQG